MTSLYLWGPVQLKIQRPLPGAALWHGHPPESDSAVSKHCPEAGDAVHEGGLKSFGKLNVFIHIYSLSILYQFFIKSYHVTLVFGTHKQIYIMSLPWCKTCTLSLCPFLHTRRTVSFSLGNFVLQNPPSGMHRKWNGRCQGEVQLSSWSLRFPNTCVAPTMWTCTLPVRYAFALAHRAISAIRRAVGLWLIQTSTGDWTKPGQWAKESVLDKSD